MHLIKITSTKLVIEHLTKAISQPLTAGKRVLWLLSGGSAIDLAVQVQQKLAHTKGLAIGQVDERFGPVGHADSNWQKLLDAGLDTKNVQCYPILRGKDFATTAHDYNLAMTRAFDSADVIIGLFGIGADGHAAGILPGSPAVHGSQLVASFEGHDFKRITITPAAIAKCNLAIAYAAGSDKAKALQQLLNKAPIAEQPAQALKLAKDSYVYNDQLEGEVT